MNLVHTLDLPIITAPMAGGPSTPTLVIAAAEAGGLGFLALGTIPAAKVSAHLDACGHIPYRRYGVNLFAPQKEPVNLEQVEKLRARIMRDFDIELAEVRPADLSNGWDEKLEAICRAENPPAVVSVTFGSFSSAEIDRIHTIGAEAWVSVANPADARRAAAKGADAIVIQGPEAGGHRYTWDMWETPDERSLMALLQEVEVDCTIIAAGGINEENIAEVLNHADAVCLGSRFLLATEAGTSAFNRRLLQETSRASVSTRAFSGR